MTVYLSALAGAGQQFFNDSGVILSGGKLYSYAAGTTTPQTTYTSVSGSIAHTNPIILNSAGRVATGEIWLTATQNYKFVLYTSTNVLIASWDNISGINDIDNFVGNLANTSNPSLGDALVGFRQSNSSGNLTGSVGRTVHQKLQESVSVLDFGATGDGVTNDTTAINTAIANSLGRKLYFPAGTYLTNGISISSLSNVNLCGEDKYSTTIKLNLAISDHVIAFANAVDCSVENMTIDQNRTGKTGGHGIRLGGVDGLTLNNLRIKSCYSYGIGIQAGTNKNVTINNFEIYDTGQDAIDIKDFNLNNESIVISNFILRDYGLLTINQTGINVRGPAVVTNGSIHITSTTASVSGFGLRSASAQGRGGFGSYSNIEIYVENGTGYGFYTEPNDLIGSNISNIYVRNGLGGVVSGKYHNINNIVVDGNSVALDGLSVFASDCNFSNISLFNVGRGIDVEPGAIENIFSNFNIDSVSGANAIRVQATANNNSFTQGVIQSGKGIDNGATGTIIRNVKNWPTASNVISTDLAVDSTGSKVFTVAHGLSVTPALEDVALTLVQSTPSANDYTLRYLRLESTTSVNIVGRIFVDVASATPGAVVKVSALVRAMGS
jgi:hypothetical protein